MAAYLIDGDNAAATTDDDDDDELVTELQFARSIIEIAAGAIMPLMSVSPSLLFIDPQTKKPLCIEDSYTTMLQKLKNLQKCMCELNRNYVKKMNPLNILLDIGYSNTDDDDICGVSPAMKNNLKLLIGKIDEQRMDGASPYEDDDDDEDEATARREASWTDDTILTMTLQYDMLRVLNIINRYVDVFTWFVDCVMPALRAVVKQNGEKHIQIPAKIDRLFLIRLLIPEEKLYHDTATNLESPCDLQHAAFELGCNQHFMRLFPNTDGAPPSFISREERVPSVPHHKVLPNSVIISRVNAPINKYIEYIAKIASYPIIPDDMHADSSVTLSLKEDFKLKLEPHVTGHNNRDRVKTLIAPRQCPLCAVKHKEAGFLDHGEQNFIARCTCTSYTDGARINEPNPGIIHILSRMRATMCVRLLNVTYEPELETEKRGCPCPGHRGLRNSLLRKFIGIMKGAGVVQKTQTPI